MKQFSSHSRQRRRSKTGNLRQGLGSVAPPVRQDSGTGDSPPYVIACEGTPDFAAAAAAATEEQMAPSMQGPFRNSPSIDSLSLLAAAHGQLAHHGARRSPSPRPVPVGLQGNRITMTGHARVGSDVPIELLQSVILPFSVVESRDLHESSRGWMLKRRSSANSNTDVLAEETLTTDVATLTLDANGSTDGSGTTTPLRHRQGQTPSPPRFATDVSQLPSTWQRAIAYTPSTTFPPVRFLSGPDRKRVLVTGGAGFVGSHLVDRLMFMGNDVTVVDNFFTGAKTAVSHWIGHPNFELVRHDVVDPFMLECDQIYHLACPASPVAYQYNSIKTMKTNFMGTMNMLGLAKRVKARFLLSSTSEVYGSPEQHPQSESYWGNVNPIGPRSCYDEGKRVAEALTYGYARENGVDIRVARIFNTFGPRMSATDGRVVSNFITQALRGRPLTIYGDGTQTRSLMYIHDLIDGLILLMNAPGRTLEDLTGERQPVNLGSQEEASIQSWAENIIDVVEQVKKDHNIATPKSSIVYQAAMQDDPPKRRPDTTRANETLGWQMRWTAKSGLLETSNYFAAAQLADLKST